MIDRRAATVALLTALFTAPVSVVAQTNDVITTSPRTFPARLQVVDANGNAIAEVSFADYIRGVLKAEIEGELNATALGLSNAQKIEALKAQALAAQSYYLRNANRCGNSSATPPTFESSISCQVFAVSPWTQNTLTAVTSADVSSRGITMNGSLVESLYFDKSPDGFTTNIETADGFYTANLRKEITPEFFTGAAPANRRHGLSQRGTGVLAGPGTVFNQGALAILQHYYGPLCPFVKRVLITQGGRTRYEHSWIDNNDFSAADIAAPAPTRTLMPGSDIAQRNVMPLGASSNATLRVEFNEYVTSPGAGIEVVIGGKTLTGGVRTRPFPANPVPEFWSFNISAEFLNSLPEPTATIVVSGANVAASNLAVDGNPGSFAFRQFNGAITACDPNSAPGAPAGDSLTLFKLDKTAPEAKIADSKGGVRPGGASDGKGISISADDRRVVGAVASPVVSGISKVEIFKDPPTDVTPANLIGSNDTDFPDQHTYTKNDAGLSILDQLPEGHIYVRVTDQAGNESPAVLIKVDRVGPNIKPRDARGDITSGTYSLGQDISVTVSEALRANGDAAPAVSGLTRFEVWKGAPSTGQLLASNDVDYSTSHVYTKNDTGLGILNQLPVGYISFKALDVVGNSTISGIFVKTDFRPFVGLSYNGHAGVASQGDAPRLTSPVNAAIINAADNFYGLKSVVFEPPLTSYTTLPPGLNLAALQPGTTELVVKASGLFSGSHRVVVTNNRDLTSSARWDIVTAPAIGLQDVAGRYAGGGVFAAQVNVDAAAINENLLLDPTQTGLEQRGIVYGVAVTTVPFERGIFSRDAEGIASIANLTAKARKAGSAESMFSMSSQAGNHLLPGYFSVNIPNIKRVGGGVETKLLPDALYAFDTADPFTLEPIHSGISVDFSIPRATVTVDAEIGFTQRAGVVTVHTVGVFDIFVDTAGNPLFTPPPGSAQTFTRQLDAQIFVDKSAPLTRVLDKHCVQKSSDGTRCFLAWDYFPSVSFLPVVYVAEVSVGPQSLAGGAAPVFPGTAGVVLAPGVTAVGPFGEYAFFTLGIEVKEPELGYRGTGTLTTYEVAASNPNLPFRIDLNTTLPSITSGKLVVVEEEEARRCGIKEIGAANSGALSIGATGRRKVGVAAREYDYMVKAGNLRFLSNVEGIIASEGVDGAGNAQALSVFRAGGQIVGGPTIRLDPTGTTFEPAGVLKYCYSERDLADIGVGESNLKLYQYDEQGLQEELPEQQIDAVADFLAAKVTSLSSIFGVFGATTPIPATDLLPPLTKVQFDVAVTTVAGVLHVAAPARVSFSALDPPFPGAPVSGVDETRYSIDPSTFIPAFTLPYTSPIALSVGTHTVYYFSRDEAGNVEEPKQATVVVTLPPTRAFALAADPGDKLWEVLSQNDEFFLGQFSGDVLISSTVLPGAIDGGFWSIAFAQGETYAVGASSTAAGLNQLVLYRVNAQGVLLSSATFSSGDDKSDFALDAAGEVWIAGATLDAQGGAKLALWRYCPHGGSLRLLGGYERGGGFDAAFGVAVESGTVWTAGYSRETPTSPLDLALWRFNSSGTLTGGPYLRPAYLQDLSDDANVRLRIDTDGLAAAASRKVGAGAQEAAFLRYARSGQVLSERTWSSDDGRGAFIGGMSMSTQGFVVVGNVASGADARLAIWRYELDGRLASAQTQVSLSQAFGAVSQGGKLWLAVDGVAGPYDGFSGTALEGQDILLSSSGVVAPPAPILMLTGFVPSTATLGETIGASLSGAGFDASTTLSLERLNARAGTWTLAPPLDEFRQNHLSVRLDDGRVLVAGGASDSVAGNFLATVRLYDPAANEWRIAAPMNAPRLEFALVKLKDGRVLAAGGFTAAGTYSASSELYDPVTDTWTLSGSMIRARQVTGTLLTDGTVLVAGGSDGGIATEVETYDPTTGLWTTRAALSEPRAAHTQVLLRDGRLMVVGGVTEGGSLLSSAALYDPATGTWSPTGSMTTPRGNFRAGLLPDGRLLAAGGSAGAEALATAELYSPVTGAWSAIASMSQARYAPSLSFIDGRVMVAGGLSGAGVSSVELYDPGENIWTPLASMVDVRYLFSLTALADGRHLAVGGEQNASPTLTAELFSAPSLSVAASGVAVVGTTTLTGILNLTGAATGYWDAVVRSGTRVARLDAAFRVLPEFVVAQSADGTASLGSWRGDETVTPVSTETVATAYAAATGEQGLDLALPFLYELSPSPVVFDPPALLSFAFDPTVVDTATLAIYRFNDPLWSSAAVTGQTIEFLSPNLARISGYLASASLYGAFSQVIDGLPPLVRLDYPAGLGVESTVGGVIDVAGVVYDTSAVSWTLTAGSVTVASGDAPITGTLAAWNTAGFSGHVSLTLSAVDAYGNTASTSSAVYVGNPALSFAIGKKDSDVIVSSLKDPTGIAVRQDGKLWVAKTGEDDGLLLLTSEGLVQGVVGDLKSPQGVALDADQNVYVADKGNDRVVKLSPDGASVLLALGRVDNHGKPKSGTGPGEFKHPWDVAVDANGDIYVADTSNTRIQVFDAAGAFLRQFGAGIFLSTSELRGLALSAEGLWVSDKELSHVVLLSREGALLRTVDDADSVVGEVSRTRGLATDRRGNLYVIEPNRDRVQKFGPGGRGQLAFGARAQATPAEREAKRFLSGPVDGAIGPDGSLWVSDAGRDRVVRFDLPVVGGFGATAFTTGGGSAGDEPEPAQRLVEAEEGAVVARDDGTGVSIPKDALPADLEVSVAKADESVDSQEKQAKKLEKRVKSASDEVEYGPEGTRFNKPVTLTIAYTPTPGLDEKNLKVHYWNPQTKDWEALDSVVDTMAKTVSAQTTHFSVYQVQGAGTGFVTAAAVDEFGLRDQYAFPNPSRRGQAVTFRMQPGLADSVELRVYDLAGRKVHSSSQFTLTTAFDDGNGKGAQHTYDHVWNVSGVGSGVYYYIIVAKRAGQSDITVRGKAGVIK